MKLGRMNQRSSSCIQQQLCLRQYSCVAVILLLLFCTAASYFNLRMQVDVMGTVTTHMSIAPYLSRLSTSEKNQKLVGKRFHRLSKAAKTSANKGKFDKLFIFGDSFVDTGNRDPENSTYTAIGRVNQNWTPPYGRTRPGQPAGRYSDGKVLADLLDFMGLKPRPYRLFHSTTTSHTRTPINDGVNFAMAGSGVFDNEGFTTTEDQIAQLKEVLLQGQLSHTDVAKKSLILYMISGNDYAAYGRNNGSTDLVSVLALVDSIVGRMSRDLTKLQEMGFRNFVVGKLAPLGCMPFSTAKTGFQSCEEEFNNLTSLHNLSLSARLRLSLPQANILFLNHHMAFDRVVYDASNPDRLKACCSGVQLGALCGDVTAAGRAQFTLCSAQEAKKFFWWDEFHPTEAGWEVIFDLFLQDWPSLYTDGKSLLQFLGMRSERGRGARNPQHLLQ